MARSTIRVPLAVHLCHPLDSATGIGLFRRSLGCSRTHRYLLVAKHCGAYPALAIFIAAFLVLSLAFVRIMRLLIIFYNR